MISIANAPVLETERLILRMPQVADFEPYAAYMASERAHFTGGPLERDMAWRAFGHMTGHWLLRGFGFFILEDRAGAAPIGMVGPHYPEGWPEPEIGWSLWSDAVEGKGLAHEAALAARTWTRETLGWTTAISLIVPDNGPSMALARRLGAHCESAWELRGKAVNIWRHPAAAPAPGHDRRGGTHV